MQVELPQEGLVASYGVRGVNGGGEATGRGCS